MRDSVRAAFIPFTTQFEGRVPWMYLDRIGLVTIGLGCLVADEVQALKLPFVDLRGNRATADQIIDAWRRVKSYTYLAHVGYKSAEKVTELRLSNRDIDALCLRRLDEFEHFLSAHYFADFAAWPGDAQLGTLSMAWAMGPGFPKSWPKFSDACHHHDWLRAKAECEIPHADASVARRNAANVTLFASAAAAQDSSEVTHTIPAPPPTGDT